MATDSTVSHRDLASPFFALRQTGSRAICFVNFSFSAEIVSPHSPISSLFIEPSRDRLTIDSRVQFRGKVARIIRFLYLCY